MLRSRFISQPTALTTQCPKCKAHSGAWCVDEKGNRRPNLHQARLHSKRNLKTLGKKFFG